MLCDSTVVVDAMVLLVCSSVVEVLGWKVVIGNSVLTVSCSKGVLKNTAVLTDESSVEIWCSALVGLIPCVLISTVSCVVDSGPNVMAEETGIVDADSVETSWVSVVVVGRSVLVNIYSTPVVSSLTSLVGHALPVVGDSVLVVDV